MNDLEMLLSNAVHTSKLKGISQERLLSIRDVMCQKYHGKTLTDWANIHGVSTYHMYRQYNKFGRVDILLDTATGGTIKRYRGLTYSQWAKKKGVTWVTINEHLKKHGNLKLVGKTHRTYQRRYHCPKGVFDSVKKVAEVMGVTFDTAYNRVHKKTLTDYPDWYEICVK